MTHSQFIAAAKRIIRVGESSDLDDETKYTEVFGVYKECHLFSWPHWKSWIDPDTTYKEDVDAFVKHIKTLLLKAESLHALEQQPVTDFVDSGFAEEGFMTLKSGSVYPLVC